jgi:catechol 2,3-dioxygenase-like lactoylglutathione lyase family enzyme
MGIRHIAFEVDDIETLVSSLQQDGVAFFGDVQTYPATGKKLVYFHGPEGIILEFAQYT